MKVLIDIHPADAAAAVEFLNDDNGLRNAVAEKLVPLNRPEAIAKMTAVTSGLGAISRGLSLALDAEKQFEADFKAQRIEQQREAERAASSNGA